MAASMVGTESSYQSASLGTIWTGPRYSVGQVPAEVILNDSFPHRYVASSIQHSQTVEWKRLAPKVSRMP